MENQMRNQGSTARSKVINNQNQSDREDFSSAVMRESLTSETNESDEGCPV
jgi:hypothetical protein